MSTRAVSFHHADTSADTLRLQSGNRKPLLINKNIQPGPEKQHSHKKRVYLPQFQRNTTKIFPACAAVSGFTFYSTR